MERIYQFKQETGTNKWWKKAEFDYVDYQHERKCIKAWTTAGILLVEIFSVGKRIRLGGLKK